MNVDPLAEKYLSWNPYAYTFQNPINFIDPDGREGRAVNDNIIVTVSNTTTNSRGEIRRDVSLSMTLTIVKGKNDDLSKTMFNKTSGSVSLSNFQGQSQSFVGGYKAYDNVTNVTINYKVVESIDKVGKDDHVMLLVDDIPKQFGLKVDPAGRAELGGRVSAVERNTLNNGSFNRVAQHEIGHLFGMTHTGDGNGLMGEMYNNSFDTSAAKRGQMISDNLGILQGDGKYISSEGNNMYKTSIKTQIENFIKSCNIKLE